VYEVDDLIERLRECPAGHAGWKQFEDICIEILIRVFVPPLSEPKIQTRTLSGIDRRDAVFPNRNPHTNDNWNLLFRELNARLVLVEFKNYDTTDIGKEEVNQVYNYLTDPMGRLALMVCNKAPTEAAHTRRNTIYSSEQKVILFLTKEELEELLYIKERGEDPADLIVDLTEWFYLQHE
jgi:hypothetical protein